jgi:hypothetical protein
MNTPSIKNWLLLLCIPVLSSCNFTGLDSANFGSLSSNNNGNPVSTCDDATSASAKVMSNYSVQDKCESGGNYVCETGGAVARGAEQQCVNLSDLGQICLTVDGSAPIKGYHCSNTTLTGNNGYLIQAVGVNLADALTQAINKCRTRTL